MKDRAPRVRCILLLFALIAAPLACANREGPQAQIPLYGDLGDHHFPITTSDPATQSYFDQGIRLTYAFNHTEAIESFRQGARLDPNCAMCYWGIALAYGPNINLPMQPEAAKPAFDALTRAQGLADKVSEREQNYIRALSERYRQPAPEDRGALDQAYADAMGEVSRRHPQDLDAATLHAEALMNLSPWDYWTADRQPKPATRVSLAQLERVLQANPDHPGACHYYIHTVESVHPERAVPCAERLAALMPGAGHIVHMPAHIYVRVGRWRDAIEANEHAVHADESYIADRNTGGIYVGLYYPHNYHFLSFAGLMAGRPDVALPAAETLSQKVGVETARELPELQGMVPYHQLILLSFQRYEDVLNSPLPPKDLPIAYSLGQYARGMALAATGKTKEARAALAELRQVAGGVDAEPGIAVTKIAEHTLAGVIHAKAGRFDEADEQFTVAIAMEDRLPYMEPPYWSRPVRHYYGDALLQNGRPDAAERVYREDLKRFPDNAWSLHGLAASLDAQGDDEEARKAYARFQEVSGRAT